MQVYVALLEKKAKLATGCYETSATSRDGGLRSWLALGHFDAIYTYPLKMMGENLFKAIRESNREIAAKSDKEHYYHPLYMVSDDCISNFWDEQRAFVGIVRIHFSKTTHVNECFETLQSALDENRQDGVDFCLFRTTELSDAILAIQSDSLRSLLSLSFSLQRWGMVGKIYTYCGINLSNISDLEWQPDDEDLLQWCTMRFSVRSFDALDEEVKTIQRMTAGVGCCQSFSIVGVDDVAISWNELPTAYLVGLYREWFFVKKPGHTLFQNFSDVTTRLGSPLKEVLEKEYVPLTDMEKAEKMQLETACDRLLKKKDAIMGHAIEDGKNQTWLKPLSELTVMLARMSSNVLLDEFVYLMLPGVSSFLDNVDGRSLKVTDDRCESFVENWANIVEHIMRVEGQLTHHPEMRPILYDIPISMLEYTLAFLDGVAEALWSADDADKHMRIQLFLTPRLSREKVTYELFAADAKIPNGLLLVYVPFDLLYEPRALLRALCHEVSHYVGEACRSREERCDYFHKAATRLAAHALFEHSNMGVIKELDDVVNQGTRGMTIKSLTEDIFITLQNRMSKPDIRRELMINALKRYSTLPAEGYKHNEEVFPFQVLNWEPEPGDLERFKILLDDLGTLFREIYADISMLYLLPIDAREYIESHEEELRYNADPRYEQTAIRIYVSLTASGKEIGRTCVRDEHIAEELKKIQDCFDRKVEDRDRLIPISTIYFLKQYGECCYSKMKRMIRDESKERVRKVFENVSSTQMEYADFLKCIDEYRSTLLGRYG